MKLEIWNKILLKIIHSFKTTGDSSKDFTITEFVYKQELSFTALFHIVSLLLAILVNEKCHFFKEISGNSALYSKQKQTVLPEVAICRQTGDFGGQKNGQNRQF